jgi:two-component system cell cycle sensor histidine kinase/response regulator CckA
MAQSALKLILVEDNPDDAEMLIWHLRDAGISAEWHRVETLRDLEAALARQPWDAVLTDYNLPGFDALEVLGRVRRDENDIPVVVVSGAIGESVAVEAMRAGAGDYVMKDNLARLVPALQREVRESRERRLNRHTTEALRKQEELFQQVRRTTHDMIWVWDPATGHTVRNDAFAAALGHTPEELEEHYEWWAERVHPDDMTRVLATISHALESNQDGWSQEYRLRHSQGGYITVLDRASVADRDAAGRPTRIVGAMIDVTPVRQMEEKLRQSQKMEAIGRLAGGVAHDFNNLLAVILGYSDLSLGALPEDHKVVGFLREIKRAGERAGDLTRQLLAFSRKQILEPRVLSLGRVVADTHQMLRRLIGEDVEIVMVADPEPAMVRADPGQIEQVIMNLAVNARDAMPQGGRLVIQVRRVELAAGEQPGLDAGPYVCLSVGDNGCGMDADTLAQIFEPFFTTKGVGRGTGLGLATVYGIVNQSGGSILVDSAMGQGTTFSIYLPRVSGAEAQALLPSVAPPNGAAPSATILLVEDEPMVREMARMILTGAGYEVLQASQGDEALRVLARHAGPVDLLLTDVVMPLMSGVELAAEFREARPGAPVLFMTGYADDFIANQALDVDVELLQKPFVAEALLGKVRGLLDRAAATPPAETGRPNRRRRAEATPVRT